MKYIDFNLRLNMHARVNGTTYFHRNETHIWAANDWMNHGAASFRMKAQNITDHIAISVFHDMGSVIVGIDEFETISVRIKQYWELSLFERICDIFTKHKTRWTKHEYA